MEHKKIKLIHIDWDGPYKLSELSRITDNERLYLNFFRYSSKK